MSARTSIGRRLRLSSYCSERPVTLPISTPSRSIAAPSAKPRTDESNTMRTGTASPSGGASAAARSVNSVNVDSGRAGGVCAVRPGVSKATPPARIDPIDWVFSVRPLAFTLRSMPLAFQNRVSADTSCWYGDWTNTLTESWSVAASRL